MTYEKRGGITVRAGTMERFSQFCSAVSLSYDRALNLFLDEGARAVTERVAQERAAKLQEMRGGAK